MFCNYYMIVTTGYGDSPPNQALDFFGPTSTRISSCDSIYHSVFYFTYIAEGTAEFLEQNVITPLLSRC